MKALLSSVFCMILCATFAQSTIQSIPNQKLINNSYVSNPDNILSNATINQIDTLLKSLEAKTSVQVAVVAVESIGNEDVFDFAQQLFNTWGIGSKSNYNGLLLLLVKDIHTVRFHTGYGLEGTLPDAICKRIQTDYMVPAFKDGAYDNGILQGLEQVSQILTNPAYAEELQKSETKSSSSNPFTGFSIIFSIFVAPVLLILFFIKRSTGKFSDSKKPGSTLYPEIRLTQKIWILEFVVLPFIIITYFGLIGGDNSVGYCLLALYVYLMCTQLYRLIRTNAVITRFLNDSKYYEIVQFLKSEQWHWLWMAIMFPLPFLLYFIYHLQRKRIYRNHPRKCRLCNGNLVKLSEKTEDSFLSNAQQLEENLRSVDYDVWKCELCNEVEEWNYPRLSSKYKACPFCKTHAFYLVSRNTLVSATYSSSGKGEQINTCKFCSKSKTTTYSIAQLVESSSSSSSGGSSGSSGGSWGGGSSGGGGASSSW